jgi:hypothetical protein
MEQVSDEIMDFGEKAACEVLKIEDAFSLAKSVSIMLYGLGGSCQGVIGALASVGQYARGKDGRFIDMPGLRQLCGRVGRQSYEKLGIRLEYAPDTREPDAKDEYETLDWVRPQLIGHKPVLKVKWSIEKNAWIPTDRKKNRPLE